MPYPEQPPKRGEIYWVDWSPSRGSEQRGHRPAVVISMDSFNRIMPTVVVAAMTTKIKPAYKVTVTCPAGSPLREAGQILAFQLMTIDKTRLDDYMGVLDASQIEELNAALRMAWGLSD
ncbi:mRNA interferase [Planobispora longispora]|uniref:mRNA interferase n=1 Tax=Planobispora longispora TaxID=28887 RepID=A0A8J3RJN9_9ACTN|nr:type II toxin-antitoxin system PemK/MazF family toxin [Planobispora longispora]GIH76125.1 mRNA interferase [Planobispora longispora]